MNKQKWLVVLVSFSLSIFLISCSTPPSEADGWEYNSENDMYVRKTTYTLEDDEMLEYLEGHEGTWTASEDPEVAIIIENESIYVGLHSGYNVYPVISYELTERQYTSKEENYEPGVSIYDLSLGVPEFFALYVDEMDIPITTLEEEVTSNEDYGFIFRAGTDGKYATYTMDRSNIEYSRVSNNTSYQETHKEEEMEETNSALIDEVYPDETYQVTVEGHNGPLILEATIINNILTDVEVIEHEETDGLADPAIMEIPYEIINTNSTNVDVVSGATITSEAIIEAVDIIVEGTGADLIPVNEPQQQYTRTVEDYDARIVAYPNNTYQATVSGHNAPLTIEASVSNESISHVEVIHQEESEGIADSALTETPYEIVSTNSTQVDTVSGATFTSEAIIEAVELIINASNNNLYGHDSSRVLREEYVNNDNIFYNQQDDIITGDNGSPYIYLEQSLKWVENDSTVEIVGFYDHLDISEIKWYVEGYDIGFAETDLNGYSANKMFKISFPIDLLSDLYNRPLDGSVVHPKIKAVDSNDEALLYIDSSVGITNQKLED